MSVTLPTRFEVLGSGGAGVAGVADNIDTTDLETLVENATWVYAHQTAVLLERDYASPPTGTQTTYTDVLEVPVELGDDRVAVDLYARGTNCDFEVEVYESDGTTSQGSATDTSGTGGTLSVTGITDTDCRIVVRVKANGGTGTWTLGSVLLIARALTVSDLP